MSDLTDEQKEQVEKFRRAGHETALADFTKIIEEIRNNFIEKSHLLIRQSKQCEGEKNKEEFLLMALVWMEAAQFLQSFKRKISHILFEPDIPSPTETPSG